MGNTDSQYTNDGDIISKPEDNEKKLENYEDNNQQNDDSNNYEIRNSNGDNKSNYQMSESSNDDNISELSYNPSVAPSARSNKSDKYQSYYNNGFEDGMKYAMKMIKNGINK